MLCNKDYIKKMTIEDYMKRCGLDPNDDNILAKFLLEQADSMWATDIGVDPGCIHCVYSVDQHASDACNDTNNTTSCEEGVVEWLNLKHEGPIPVVAKPFVYDGEIVGSFSIDYYDGNSFIRLYDNDECDTLIDSIPFSKEEQEKMYDAVGGDSVWQWNYLSEMFGDKDNCVTVITEEDVE